MATLFTSVLGIMKGRGINEDLASSIAGDVARLVEEKFTSTNSAMVPCKSWINCRRNQFCPIGEQCGSTACMIAQHQ